MNAHSEEYDLPQNLKLLNKWTIPKVSSKEIYNFGIFDNLRNSHVVKTIEESVSMDNEEKNLPLLSAYDINRYQKLNINFSI